MDDEQSKRGAHQNPPVEREPTDVNVRGVLWFLAALVVGGVLIHGAMWWIKETFTARERSASPPLPSLAARERVSLPKDLSKIPIPRLEISASEALQELRDYESVATKTYGWVDREAGIVRIPVDRAMDLVLRENQLAFRQAKMPAKTDRQGANYER
jgi:hypothetical protein